ncbi:MAG TPA: AMP-binding protein [Vicinamibacterales bacterium]|nr:AMP-binding protein [Vicinamibacterales bacterium]
MTRSLFTLSDIARTGAGRFRNATALEDARGTHRLTYGELWACVQTSAGVLRALGLAPRDRVLLYMDGSPDWITAFLSIVHAGLVAVPIPGQAPPELARAAAWYAEVKACVCGESTRDAGSRISAVRCLTPAALVASDASPVPVTTATPDATAVLVFTSGSTSNPRAVALSHDNLLANLRSLMEVRRAREGEALLSTLPPSHAFELVAGQLAPLAAGARIVYAGTLLPNRLVELMRGRAITRILSVPSLVEVLAREILGILTAGGTIESTCRESTIEDLASAFRRMEPPEQGRIRRAVRNCVGPSFRNLVVGGAALGPVWADLLPGIGIELEVGYGLTEAGPIVAVGFEAECPSGSVGRPLPGISVRVDVHGEILVRSEGVMQGYFKDAAGSAAALEDGWLRTGDCGRLDDEGFLFVTGRLKEAIVTASGETVYPDEIEPFYSSALFAGHCVVPVRGRDGNDVPTLVVEPASTDTSDAELQQAFLALRAAAPPRLRAASMVRYAGRFPRTALGKIRRRALADSLAREGVPA